MKTVGSTRRRVTTKEKSKDTRLRREFHTTLEEYNRVLKHQNYCCAICKKKFNKKGELFILSVDHSHITGLIRGLLCYVCNKFILGRFQDNVNILKAAVEYLEHPPFVVALGKEIYSAPGSVGTKARSKLLDKMKKQELKQESNGKKKKRKMG